MVKTRLLVVDDSVFMRKALESILSNEPDIEIVGFGRNGEEAVELASKLSPDIITLDIEMPKMDGLKALELIMKNNPIPILMVSSLTQEGAEATLKALEMGAVDFIPKENTLGTGIQNIENDLKEKIRKFAKNKSMLKLLARRYGSSKENLDIPTVISSKSDLQKSPAGSSKVKRVVLNESGNKKIVALGTSTGGPQSLQKVIPMLPENLGVPVVITQHMPPTFTKSLASRLNGLSKLTVIEAQGKEKLEPNVVYIAKGGQHLKFVKVGGAVYTELDSEPSNFYNIPSVDVMVSSIVDIYGKDCLGVIMTGMGTDGANGLKQLKDKKGLVISQDEETCVVYGMPKAVVSAGLADEIVPLEEIYTRIVYHCK